MNSKWKLRKKLLSAVSAVAFSSVKKTRAKFGFSALNIKKSLNLLREAKRGAFYRELRLHCVFLLILFFFLSYLPIFDAFTAKKAFLAGMNTFDDGEGLQQAEILPKLREQMGFIVEKPYMWRVVGAVSLRHLRVRGHECITTGTCYGEFSPSNEETDPYGPLSACSNNSHARENITKFALRGFKHRFGLSMLPPLLSYWTHFIGISSGYGTGGFEVLLPANKTLSTQILEELTELEWVDRSVRTVAVTWTLFNPHTQLFSAIQFMWERGATGGVNQEWHVHSFRFEEALNRNWKLILLSDSMFLLGWMTLVLFVYFDSKKLVHCVRTRGWIWLKDSWEMFDAVHCLVFSSFLLATMLFWVQRLALGLHLRDALVHPAYADQFIDLLPLGQSLRRVFDLAAFACFLSIMKVFKYLRMNMTMNLLWRTLGMASGDLFAFCLIFVIVNLGYAVSGHFLFGHSLDGYRTISTSFATCFQMLIGDFNYDDLRQGNPQFASIYFATFMVLVFLITVNVFVAIVSDFYTEAQRERRDLLAQQRGSADVEYDLLLRLKQMLLSLSPTVSSLGSFVKFKAGDQVRVIQADLLNSKRKAAHRRLLSAARRVRALVRFGFRSQSRTDGATAGGRRGSIAGLNCKPLPRRLDLPVGVGEGAVLKGLRKGDLVSLDDGSFTGEPVLFRVFSVANAPSDTAIVLGTILSARGVISGGEKIVLPATTRGKILTSRLLKYLAESVFATLPVWVKGKMKWSGLGRQSRAPKTRLLMDLNDLEKYFKERMCMAASDAEADDSNVTLRFDQLLHDLRFLLRKTFPERKLTETEIEDQACAVFEVYAKAMQRIDDREREGYQYTPRPLDTSSVKLGAEIRSLAEDLAKHCHEKWAAARIQEGYVFGPKRVVNGATKTHPNLVPYSMLPESEKDMDRTSALGTLQAMLSLGYAVKKSAESNVQNWTGGVAASSPEETYHPIPIQTDNVILESELLTLTEMLAENMHELWSQQRVESGWTYGKTRDDAKKHHPCLVPYTFLTDGEKEYDRILAIGTLRAMVALGYTISQEQ